MARMNKSTPPSISPALPPSSYATNCLPPLSQVLLDDAISSVELVNCQRMQVQVRGSVPSVAVDKTDGFLCYLGKDGLATTFVTSKVYTYTHTYMYTYISCLFGTPLSGSRALYYNISLGKFTDGKKNLNILGIDLCRTNVASDGGGITGIGLLSFYAETIFYNYRYP